MNVPFVYVNGNLTILINGQTHQIRPEHPAYGQIKKALKTATPDQLLKLLDTQTAIKTFIGDTDKASVVNGVVYFNGKPVHTCIANRVIEFMREGLPFEHLLRFLERVSLNPSYQSQLQLFDFLQNKGLPITDDGCFLAYKAVRSDWMDKYSGTIDNSIGKGVSVQRAAVDDNRNNQCSKGLHVGAMDYVNQYGDPSSGDHVIVVKVDPKDAVSVPTDHSFQKLRVCAYKVMYEFQGELNRQVYKQDCVTPVNDVDEDDWDWCDEDDDGYDNSYDDGYNDGYYGDEYDDSVADSADGYADGYASGEANSYEDEDEDEEEPSYHNKRDKYGRFCRK